MDIRFQLVAAFNLGRCDGCQACAVACKELWTDSAESEHMWWSNVELKPGPGYPNQWEDQNLFPGGWTKAEDRPQLKSPGKIGTFLTIFHHPAMPSLADYYEPWTCEDTDLTILPEDSDQPTAIPRSLISGELLEATKGPLTEHRPEDTGTSFFLPRICNHCLNPSCVAACPSGALYKRGEDGIILVDQDQCRGWRHCIPACPYKKIFLNWKSVKAEKCHLCFSLMEDGRIPACLSACPRRATYLGLLAYDADRIAMIASADDEALVDTLRSAILNPRESVVADEAARAGYSSEVIELARRSPIYRLVVEWKLALPLHPEFRTIPMVFYLPPTLSGRRNSSESDVKELAHLFAAGSERPVLHSLQCLSAVRSFQRARLSGEGREGTLKQLLNGTGLTVEAAEAVFRMVHLADMTQRHVVPSSREFPLQPGSKEPALRKRGTGFGGGTNPRPGS